MKDRHSLDRRSFLLVIGVLLLSVVCVPGFAAEDGTEKPLFSFVQFTDTHMTAGDRTDKVERAIEDVNLLRTEPRFVVVTGDLINDDKPDASVRLYRRVFSRLEVPVYSVHGNHDNRKAFEKWLHPVNIAFDSEPYHFIVLNPITGPVGDVSEEDAPNHIVNWLENHLKSVDKDTPIIVFTHATPYRPGADYKGLPGADSNYETALKLLKPYNVVAWFGGHFHARLHVEKDGVDYFSTGCISNVRSNGNVPLGYRIVRVYDDHVDTVYRTIKQFREPVQAATAGAGAGN